MRLLPSSYAPKPPTEKQAELMRRIQALTSQLGKPPSLAEVATYHANLERLRLQGWVWWDPEKPRSLCVTEAGEAAMAAKGGVS
jgi:SOS-response transcriptional repressor LexA